MTLYKVQNKYEHNYVMRDASVDVIYTLLIVADFQQLLFSVLSRKFYRRCRNTLRPSLGLITNNNVGTALCVWSSSMRYLQSVNRQFVTYAEIALNNNAVKININKILYQRSKICSDFLRFLFLLVTLYEGLGGGSSKSVVSKSLDN